MAYDSTDFVVEVDETTSILKDARSLIQNGWCQNALALDKYGRGCPTSSDIAVSFCALGAISRASGKYVDSSYCADDCSRFYNAHVRLMKVIGDCVAKYNNTHTKEEVLTMFDRAIANRV